MAVGYRETVLAPRFSRVMAVLVVAVCALTEVSLIVYGRPEPILRATPAVILAGVGAYVLFWAPRIRIGPAELEIVNPLRSRRISWPAILDIDAKWSLTVITVRGRVTAWAAPSPGALADSSRFRRPRGLKRSEPFRAEPSRAVGAVAERLILAQWSEYRDRGVLGAVEGPGVVTTWNRVACLLVGVFSVLTVAGILWP